MTIAKRLNEICKEKGVQKKALAEKIGVAQSTLQTWISRGEDFPAQYVMPMCEFLGVSPLRLLTGEEERVPSIGTLLSEDEASLLLLFRDLDWEGRAVVSSKAVEESRRVRAGSPE